MFKFLLKVVLPLAVLGGAGVWVYYAVVNRQLNINSWFIGGMTLGVDLSSYQTEVDFEELGRQGVKFAYIKATEGDSHVDTTFAEKWEASASAEMPAGAYHYFVYGNDGAKQAENFVATVGELNKSRLIPAVDMELTPEEVMNPPSKDTVVMGLKAFMNVVEKRYGVKPLIYARKDYYEKYLQDDFADYPRWVTNVFFPVYLDVGDNWQVWQYNDCGSLSGYTGEKCIDLNVVNNKFGMDALKF